jgi:diguanylate cyclase (GGDEF)-like protein
LQREEGSVAVSKLVKYELMYQKAIWVFILTGVAFALYGFRGPLLHSNRNHMIITIGYYMLLSMANLFKQHLLARGFFKTGRSYFFMRVIELLLLDIGIIFVQIGDWAYYYSILILMVTTLTRGRKMGLTIFGIWGVMNGITYLGYNLMYPGPSNLPPVFSRSASLTNIIFYYVISIVFVILCGMIHKDGQESDDRNTRLVKELEEKYDLLAVAQEDANFQYEKLKNTNTKLEEANVRLTSSIAEFYTLQQISKAISSIFDIKELLKYVNDIILGVMGVNYSTIILYDEKKSRLKVHTTNIRNRAEMTILTDHINSSVLQDVLRNTKPIIENFVDPGEYEFAKGREVNSLICIPLSTKSRKLGLVLIEHKYNNAFDDENARLLDIIGQQVAIAMENAHLYQQMQVMATIDGLTGVHNRLYFQERLQTEFKEALEGNYPLSLAIFDADHFKRFNDTFGHLFGDKVLKCIAELVGNSLRNNDVIARYGGEEFIILFPRTGIREAYEKVEKIRQAIAGTTIKDNLVSASVTASFGVACFPDSSGTELELLRDADDALYEAKTGGRNCVRTAASNRNS